MEKQLEQRWRSVLLTLSSNRCYFEIHLQIAINYYCYYYYYFCYLQPGLQSKINVHIVKQIVITSGRVGINLSGSSAHLVMVQGIAPSIGRARLRNMSVCRRRLGNNRSGTSSTCEIQGTRFLLLRKLYGLPFGGGASSPSPQKLNHKEPRTRFIWHIACL